MSLDTNNITFENYTGLKDMEMLNAINISIDLSLPYNLNAYMPVGISNADNSQTMDTSMFNIKESSDTIYKQFINTNSKVILKGNCAVANRTIHKIDLKLSSNKTYKSDIYKTVIKFEAEQK